LEAKSVHPGRTARSHLRALAATHGISTKRVDEVIELVGLGAVATKRAGDYSLGMGQRLGLAAALLGDPETLILDEPINGLDPEGVAWVRSLLKYLAEEGRTVFISSHLMSEMSMIADHIIIIGRGRLISDSPMSDLIERASGRVIKVRSPDAAQIREVVSRSGRTVTDTEDGAIMISGLSPEAVGKEAARRGWVLYELTPVQRSLEDVYMELTDSAQEFRTESRFNELAASQHSPVESVPDEEAPPPWIPPQDDVDDTDEDAVYTPPRIEPDTQLTVSLDERAQTIDPEHQTRTTEYDSLDASRTPWTDSIAKTRSSDPVIRQRSVRPEPARPRLPDHDPLVRPRPTGSEPPVRSRSSEPPLRPRSLGSEPVIRPRSSGSEPPMRPRSSDSEPPLRPRSLENPLLRSRSLDSEPSPKPRLEFGTRSSDSHPAPQPRFMDTEYSVRPRPVDPERYRSRLREPDLSEPPHVPDEERAETSADPFRLPRPRPPESRSATPVARGSSDPNTPRRAWGV